ncbi:MAG TPA: hypothetical protein VJ742_13310 [Nitrososphaera sp.]|nr:hypothetical protein [Nitrososphaera sp.]
MGVIDAEHIDSALELLEKLDAEGIEIEEGEDASELIAHLCQISELLQLQQLRSAVVSSFAALDVGVDGVQFVDENNNVADSIGPEEADIDLAKIQKGLELVNKVLVQLDPRFGLAHAASSETGPALCGFTSAGYPPPGAPFCATCEALDG